MKIIGIKSKEFFYFRSNDNYGYVDMNRYFCDGLVPDETFMKGWYKTKKCFSKIEKKESQPCINKRYELKDKDKFKDLKHVYKKEDVVLGCDEGGDIYFTDDFNEIRSLYEFKQDKQPDKMVSVEFELIIVGEVESITKPKGFKWEVYRTQWNSDGVREINSSDIQKRLIDEINTPDILLHEKTSSINSKTFYNIIRKHVKDNIDSKYAEITSDYKFCFTVKKKIEKDEAEKYTIDANYSIFSKRKKKPRLVTKYRTERLIDIFEMTNDEDKYKGYTVIDGVTADNEEELIKKINDYLEKLMEKINKPLKDCPHCKGMGVIIEN